ncbi:MAG: hypothetical protein MUF54_20035, partial [Polyangiaceae bacterium]|nr:hypothetical protein [Polyangiaceae bacterium]
MERQSSEQRAEDSSSSHNSEVRRATAGALRPFHRFWRASRASLPLAGLIASGTSMGGCDDDPMREIDACIEASMQEGRQAFWVQGVWRITGEGERDGCAVPGYNADAMELRSQPLRVHQQGHYVFLESGQAARLPGLSLSG